MSLKGILLEGATDILFHFTGHRGVLSIIKNNEFNTTNVIGSKADQRHNTKGFYMFSTQRSGSGKLGYAKFRSDVRIVLDGRKISQRYKAKPVDYMGVSRDPKDYISKDDMIRNVEMEDRVITDQARIPNALSYITRIDILFDPNHKRESTYAYKIFEASKGKFDEIYFFTEDQRRDWENQRYEKAIKDPTELDLEIDEDREEFVESAYQMDEILMYLYFMDEDKFEESIDILSNDEKFLKNYKQYYEDEYDSPEDYIRKDVEEIFDRKLRYLAYPIIEQELVSVLNTAFHNNRSSTNRAVRDVIQLFTRSMRSLKLSTLKDVVEYVQPRAEKKYNS